jgi:hypothetical protein
MEPGSLKMFVDGAPVDMGRPPPAPSSGKPTHPAAAMAAASGAEFL